MMRYFKVQNGEYIVAFGKGSYGDEITIEQYLQIQTALTAKPSPTETTDYLLKTDLTWESYEIDPPEPDHEPTVEDKAEAYDILTGVSE